MTVFARSTLRVCKYMPTAKQTNPFTFASPVGRKWYSNGTKDQFTFTKDASFLIGQAYINRDKPAIISGSNVYTYGYLVKQAKTLSQIFLSIIKKPVPSPSEPTTIAFLTPRDFSYVSCMFAIWMTGAVAVPLCPSHPPEEMAYVMSDAKASLVVYHPNFVESMSDDAIPTEIPQYSLAEEVHFWNKKDCQSYTVNDIDRDEMKFPLQETNALMIYTSGTTGRPKGCCSTFLNLENQVVGLYECWQWTRRDHLLHALPLHHVHGVVVALLTGFYAGAVVELLPKFDPGQIWGRLLSDKNCNSSDITSQPPTIFMGVPTMYSKLISYYDSENGSLLGKNAKEIKTLLESNIRLMTSGSAPLSKAVMSKWEMCSGHRLLERYGMTECGIVLSNPYAKNERRVTCVGKPLNNIECAIIEEADADENLVKLAEPGQSGELVIRGHSVFNGYWRNAKATQNVFINLSHLDTAHHNENESVVLSKEALWYRTGDYAVFEDGYYKILGRMSADIIKTGGYKVSALEIENVLQDHPNISEVCVMGVTDEEYGQRVGALIVLKNQQDSLELKDLRSWCRDKLGSYKIPSLLELIDTIPRNIMGKVNKKALVGQVFKD